MQPQRTDFIRQWCWEMNRLAIKINVKSASCSVVHLPAGARRSGLARARADQAGGIFHLPPAAENELGDVRNPSSINHLGVASLSKALPNTPCRGLLNATVWRWAALVLLGCCNGP